MKPHIRFDTGEMALHLLDQRLLPTECADFVCRAKKEIGPWHGAQVPSDAKLAVESSNAALGRVNVQCARWTNPRPDAEILSIEPVSARSSAVPAIVAITAER